MSLNQTLEALDQQLEHVLAQGNQPLGLDERDEQLEQLGQLMAKRQTLLGQIVGTEFAENGPWLQAQLFRTQQLAAKAQAQLEAQFNQFGGYRKARRQLQTYQQVKAGKG